MKIVISVLSLLTVLAVSQCYAGREIAVTTSSFKGGEEVDARYRNDGDNISPALAWENIPEGTKEIVVICDDPDAPYGTFTHWIVFNIPPVARGLKEGVSSSDIPDHEIKFGRNDFNGSGYDGPRPPWGVHRYYFKVYAVDTTLGLDSGASRKEVLDAMKGHVLAEGQVMGKATARPRRTGQ